MKSSFFLGLMVLASFSAQAQTDFPKIDPGTQQVRDTDRGYILELELKAETAALAAAESRLVSAAPGERDKLATDVERHKKNLIALRAEISRLGGNSRNEPVRLKAALAAPGVHAAASAPPEEAPYWDVYRRKQDWKATNEATSKK